MQAMASMSPTLDRSSTSTTLENVGGSCDLCKQMKIKCQKDGDRCRHCIDRAATCHFTPLEKKVPKMNRRDYIASLEHRIERIEGVFKASGLGETIQQGSVEEKSHDELADKFSTLVINEKGESKYIGSASNFSLFSPRGVSWVSEKTGSHDLAKVIADQAKWDWATWREFRMDTWQPLSKEHLEPLPTKDKATTYVEYFFQSVNSTYPLYNRQVFDRYLEQQYSACPPDDNAWYASLNIVLAIGSVFEQIRLRGSVQLGSIIDHQNPSLVQAWKYFRNASSNFIELFFRNSKLMAVQAVVAMALMMQMNPNPHASYALIAAAGRIALRLGIHRYIDRSGTANGSEVEPEERSNVFWIIYILDKGACVRSGCPPTIHDEDIGIRIPDPEIAAVQTLDGSRIFPLFRYFAELALIESKVHSQLYSARSRLRPLAERLLSIARLDSELQRFKKNVEIEVRPGCEVVCPESHFVAVLMLHFSYYDCLETIHRASVHHRSWFTETEHARLLSEYRSCRHPDLNPRIYASTDLCLFAARSMVGLVKYFMTGGSQPREGLSWMAVYYPLSASLTLFANLLQNPEDPNASDDLSLIQLVLDFLADVMTSDKSIAASRTYCIFQEVHRTAALHVNRTAAKSLPKEKRKRDDRELSGNNAEGEVSSGQPETTAMSPYPTRYTEPLQPELPATLTTTVTTCMPEDSAAAQGSTNIPFPDFVPGMGMYSFDWEMMNLSDWAGGGQGPLHDV